MESNREAKGSLIFIGLPIGNLKDITINALEALKSGKYFFVEDTRSFMSLLDLLNVDRVGKVVDSFHDQSDKSKVNKIIRLLHQGNDVFYCSEAGSPSISDPGVKLLKELNLLDEEIQIKSFSGVSSVIVALESCSVVFSKFMFHGFFPRDKKGQIRLIDEVSKIDAAHVLFESPHRLDKSLSLITSSEHAPDFIYVCRELTKKFEQVTCLKRSDNFNGIDEIKNKGEFVIVLKYERVSGARSELNRDKLIKIANDYINGDRRPKSLSKILSLITDMDAKEVYSKITK